MAVDTRQRHWDGTIHVAVPFGGLGASGLGGRAARSEYPY
jgi:hypothetical protein